MQINPSELSADADYLVALARHSQNHHGDKIAGPIMAICGMAFSLQAVVIWLQQLGALPGGELAGLIVSILALGAMTASLVWGGIVGKDLLRPQTMMGRALAGIFCGGGIATGVLAITFIYTAKQQESWAIFALFPAVQASLQGIMFFAAGVMRRQIWLMGIAAGWFVTAFLIGFTVGTLLYLPIVAAGLFLFLGIPGLIIMIRSRQS